MSRTRVSTDAPSGPSLVVRTVADRVYDTLRQEVLDGRLLPGERLRESILAQRFGVSVTPIREAITRLSRDGLVSVDRYKGASVAHHTVRDFEEFYRIRIYLEVPAARLATVLASDAALARIRALADEGDALDARTDPAACFRLDLEFHRVLVGESGNTRLVALATDLHERVQMVRRWLAPLPERWPAATAEHHRIVEAMVQRDPEGCALAVGIHLDNVRRDVTAALAGRQG